MLRTRSSVSRLTARREATNRRHQILVAFLCCHILGLHLSGRGSTSCSGGYRCQESKFGLTDAVGTMITISPGTPGEIGVTFLYSATAVAAVKTVKGGRWHPDGKYWSFPKSGQVLSELLSAFAGEQIDIHPSLRPPTGLFHIDALLEQVRHVVRVKHYSRRTEENYVPWIRRYVE